MRERQAEVRSAVQIAEDPVLMLAERLVNASAEGLETVEAEALAAVRERDELRALLELWNLAVREIGSDPAIRGRR